MIGAIKMSAITIGELIAQREEIQSNKNHLYDIETSIGTITIKQPSSSLIAEVGNMKGLMSDEYLILKTCIEPQLTDKDLQEAYQCINPTDICEKLWKVGEIRRISNAIMDAAGYGGNIKAQIHKDIKN